MKIKYHTAKGSIYVQTRGAAGDYWVKEASDGTLHSLAGGVLAPLDLLAMVVANPSTSSMSAGSKRPLDSAERRFSIASVI